MGVKGSYAQTLQGIKNLKDLGQIVKINTVILKLNYRDLPKLARFLLNLKIDEVRFVYPTLEGNVLKDPYNILARISTISPYLQKAIKIVSKKIPVSVYNVTPCFLPKYEKFITDIGGAETYLRGPNFECLLNKNRKKMKIKSSICDDCIYNNHCYGILKNYVKFFGFDELKLKQSSK